MLVLVPFMPVQAESSGNQTACLLAAAAALEGDLTEETAATMRELRESAECRVSPEWNEKFAAFTSVVATLATGNPAEMAPALAHQQENEAALCDLIADPLACLPVADPPSACGPTAHIGDIDIDLRIRGNSKTVNNMIALGTAEQTGVWFQDVHMTVAGTQAYGHKVSEIGGIDTYEMQFAGVPIPAADGGASGACGVAENHLGDLVEIMCYATAHTKLFNWATFDPPPYPEPFNVEMWSSGTATPIPCDD